MRRPELEHVIRAVARVSERDEVFIIGSQAVLGAILEPPEACTVSAEADIFIPGIEDSSFDALEAALGEGSQFHEQFGDYAQPVEETTAKLPSDWRSRAVRI
jgi:hypothetical protein